MIVPQPDPHLFRTDFAPEEFATRRARVLDGIGASAHALVQGATDVRAFQPFRQSNEFYYLCGVEVPRSLLLLRGDARTTTLYLPARESKSGDDHSFAAEDAEVVTEITGVDAVRPVEALADDLGGASAVYTPFSPAETQYTSRDVLAWGDRALTADPWDGRPTREGRLRQLLAERLPGAKILDLSPILDSLRLIKSEAELRLLRRAGELSALAVTHAMRATRPGGRESDLWAIANYVFHYHGARGEGYRSIIPSGWRAWHGHYGWNDGPLADGDLILMDAAPDYAYYTSDIGRMWPVNGRYAPWQRELYGFVVDYHKALLARIRPGVTADEVMEEATAAMSRRFQATEFSKPTYRGAAMHTLDFGGHMSHPVGMAVHDVGDYRPLPLAPGMVFTVDPQMWVPEERLYIRCEDTVAVTADGIENLTAAAPLDLDEVESVVGRGGAFPVLPRLDQEVH